MTTPLADRIDALLPQTQCTRCGYPACRPYAEAIAAGEAEINQCPPGGAAGIVRLANLLGRAPLELNPANGFEQALTLAAVEEQHCIGCTLCIQACPTDAIIGAPKQMHTVISDACTGCGLCIPPCPVDCIILVPAPFDWTDERAAAARKRYGLHEQRTRVARDKAQARAAEASKRRKKAIVQAAIERARALRAGAGPRP